jgi:hypothetical protein
MLGVRWSSILTASLLVGCVCVACSNTDSGTTDGNPLTGDDAAAGSSQGGSGGGSTDGSGGSSVGGTAGMSQDGTGGAAQAGAAGAPQAGGGGAPPDAAVEDAPADVATDVVLKKCPEFGVVDAVPCTCFGKTITEADVEAFATKTSCSMDNVACCPSVKGLKCD